MDIIIYFFLGGGTFISERKNILKNVPTPLYFLSGYGHLWAERNVTSSKEPRYSEIDGMTEEKSSSRASLSSSVYSCESEEDLKEGSAPELGTIETV